SVRCTLLPNSSFPRDPRTAARRTMNTLFHVTTTLLVIALLSPIASGQIRKGKSRNEPPADDGRAPQATPVSQIKVAKDFKVELLYSVPRNEGSWVSMCTDDKGRLIVSDQANAGLFRVTPPPVGQASSLPKVEPIKLNYTWP